MIQIYNHLHKIHPPNHNQTHNNKIKTPKQNNQSNNNFLSLEKHKKD